jgi:hypothetical protein
MARGKGAKLRAAANPNSVSLADMSDNQLRTAAAQMKKLTPQQLRAKNPQLSGLTDEQIRAYCAQMEAMADDPVMRRAVLASQNDPVLRDMAGKSPEDMTPEEFHKIIVSQRDMYNRNPDQFWKLMEQNEQVRGLPREEVIKNLNTMADMEPSQLAQYLQAQKMLAPLARYYGKFNQMCYGQGGKIIMAKIFKRKILFFF